MSLRTARLREEAREQVDAEEAESEGEMTQSKTKQNKTENAVEVSKMAR